MESGGLQARIQHHIADLRARFPCIGACHASLEDWHEDTGPRYALQLDIRSPQHQSRVSGPARASAEEAVRAAFDLATRSLEPAHS